MENILKCKRPMFFFISVLITPNKTIFGSNLSYFFFILLNYLSPFMFMQGSKNVLVSMFCKI